MGENKSAGHAGKHKNTVNPKNKQKKKDPLDLVRKPPKKVLNEERQSRSDKENK